MPEMREITASAQIHIADAVDIMISPTEIEVSTSRYDEAAEISLSGLTDLADDQVADRWPDDSEWPVGLTVDVNGTRIASGTLADGHTDETGLWSGEAYGAIRNLEATTATVDLWGQDIVTAARAMLNEVGIPPADEVDEESGAPAGTPTYRIEKPPGYDEALAGNSDPALVRHYKVQIEFTNKPTPQALTALLAESNWRWWVNENNTIIVSATLNSEEHEPRFILETTAGIQSPPYQSVVVTGARRPQGTVAGPLTERGERAIGKGVPIRVRAPQGGGEPVFRTTDRTLDTVEKAEQAAQKIWEELLIQRRSGEIEILGIPEIRPLDGVRVPEQMGGESYLVSEMTTKVNNNDGFIQTIGVGGLLDAGPGGELADPPETEIIEQPTEEDGEGEDGGDGETTGPGGTGGTL